jgi:hypothetical protein
MNRLAPLFLAVTVGACDKQATTGGSGTATTNAATGATTGGAGTWWDQIPETADDIEDAKKNAQTLVGRWFTRDDKLPAGYCQSYEFKADGTFAPLDKDGKPQKGGGSWKIIRSRGKNGLMTFTGESAPASGPMDFKFVNDAFFLSVRPTAEAPNGNNIVYLRQS